MNRILVFALICSLIMLIGCKDSDDEKTDTVQYNHHQQFDEKSFLQGQYFWLTDHDIAFNDGKSVAGCRDSFRKYFNRSHVTLPAEDCLSDLELFVSVTNSGNDYFGPATAIQFLPSLSDSVFSQDQNHVIGMWKHLVNDVDYDFDPQLGYVRLKQPIQNSQALACAFSTVHGGYVWDISFFFFG